MKIQKKYSHKEITYDDLWKIIKPGNRIFISSGPATPLKTLHGIVDTIHSNLADLEIIQLALLGDFFLSGKYRSHKFRLKTFTVGEIIGKAFLESNADFIPTNMGELPYLFVSGAVGVDIAIIETSAFIVIRYVM